MNFSNTIPTDALDILFLNRNKSYGAYSLRKNYNKRLFTALLVMTSFCMLASAIVKWNSAHQKLLATPWVSNVITLKSFKETDPLPVQPPTLSKPVHNKPQQIATIKITTPVIVADKLANAPIPTNKDAENIKIDVTTVSGIMDNSITAPPLNEGTGAEKNLVKSENYDDVFTIVQQQARFPGGTDAWKKYLERNLRQETPADNGATVGSYTVIVSFLVDKTGAISEVKADNDPGYGTASEAVRVIAHGPKWQPAVQNGRNVIYRQKQAITFVISEQ